MLETTVIRPRQAPARRAAAPSSARRSACGRSRPWVLRRCIQSQPAARCNRRADYTLALPSIVCRQPRAKFGHRVEARLSSPAAVERAAMSLRGIVAAPVKPLPCPAAALAASTPLTLSLDDKSALPSAVPGVRCERKRSGAGLARFHHRGAEDPPREEWSKAGTASGS